MLGSGVGRALGSFVYNKWYYKLRVYIWGAPYLFVIESEPCHH